MKKKLLKTSVKAQQMDASLLIQAISQPKTKDRSLLLAQIGFVGLILAFSLTLIVIFGV